MEKIVRDKPLSLLIIGGSAGSLDVLMRVLPHLVPAVNLAIIIVLHRKGSVGSTLTELIAGKTRFEVKEADDKDELLPGWIFLAPPDYHLLVENDRTLSLDFSEKINFSRPCIDVTFQTAAEVYGQELCCLLLSGASSDGAEGLELVHNTGGITAVQNPASAEVPYMPQQAIEKCQPQFILNIEEIAIFINSLNEQSA